ncbi:SSS family solute:Na+ symporter [Alkalihalobacillus xiaoxiensis]|uniref:SSS family solute:Na+ symporter n=1 Tax=Shouchella xiaoxiensis TaxID=766895 RepID=A0ABS2SVI2_9BACI|nr:sodium:solute symporter family protein [Shouchella xiaoxiensis]MBM7839021.1 SSS family solute:Na+ symporter [Shouchella xiaoxiensis]
MSHQLIYLIVFALFALSMVFISVIVSRGVKSGEDFLMGGRGLSVPLLVGTTIATLVGTGSSMGAVSYAFNFGWAGALYGVGGALGIFLLLILFSDVRKYNLMTFSEELSFYYGANRIVKGVTSILLYIASIGWLGAHIMGGSYYLAWITGLDPILSRIIVALAFAIFTIIGGYMAVVYTDTFQAVILFLGFIMLAVLSINKIGGMGEVSNQVNDGMTTFLGLGAVGWLPGISLAVVIAVGVLATPSYRHRIYSSSNIKTVKTGFLITGILFALFSILPSIIGMSTYALDPTIDAEFAFPYLVTEVFPVGIGAIILISGLSATISSGSSDYLTAVTILLRDVVYIVTGKMPDKKKMVLYSRLALVFTLFIALVATLGATGILDYIQNFISTVMTGLFVAALLGKFWSRATWQGGIASILGGSGTAVFVLLNDSLISTFGNPVLPSLGAALVAGVIVSLITPRNQVTDEEALRILDKERSIMDEGTTDPLKNIS